MKAIHVLRKPCSESTVAGNVLTHGCGGLNIDAARIRWTSSADSESAASTSTGFAKSRAAGRIIQSTSIGRKSRDRTDDYTPAGSGRWPANVVFQHLDGCVQTGMREDFISTAVPGTFGVQTGEKLSGLKGIGKAQFVNAPTTTPVYECAEGCPVAALDAQSGVSTSIVRTADNSPSRSTNNPVPITTNMKTGMHHDDTGGASRFFKQMSSS